MLSLNTVNIITRLNCAPLCCVYCAVVAVTCMTQLDNVVYAVRSKSSVILRYAADTFSSFAEDIIIEGMKYPRDIVACQDNRHLYVTDSSNFIWQVPADDHSYVKCLTLSSPDIPVDKLSMTKEHLLVTSCKRPTVRRYSRTNKGPPRDVQLPQYVKYVYHAVEMTRRTFVVGHRGTLRSELQYAVSELFRFCYVLQAFN